MFLIIYKCMFIYGRFILGLFKVGMFFLLILFNLFKVVLVNCLKFESGVYEVCVEK